jgi:hypothetical protein
VRQRVRGLLVGFLVGASVGVWVFLTLHAIVLAAVAWGGIVGLAIFAVVATRSDPADEAADAAWRVAAPDLPPTSDRLTLERAQEHIDGPDAGHRGRRPAGQDPTSRRSRVAKAAGKAPATPRRALKIEVDAGAAGNDPVSSAQAGGGAERP